MADDRRLVPEAAISVSVVSMLAAAVLSRPSVECKRDDEECVAIAKASSKRAVGPSHPLCSCDIEVPGKCPLPTGLTAHTMRTEPQRLFTTAVVLNSSCPSLSGHGWGRQPGPSSGCRAHHTCAFVCC